MYNAFFHPALGLRKKKSKQNSKKRKTTTKINQQHTDQQGEKRERHLYNDTIAKYKTTWLLTTHNRPAPLQECNQNRQFCVGTYNRITILQINQDGSSHWLNRYISVTQSIVYSIQEWSFVLSCDAILLKSNFLYWEAEVPHTCK